MSPLRYGYVSNGLAGHRLDDALELLAENGYGGIALTLDHVHFDPFAPEPAVRSARLRTRLDDLGLDCVVETGGRFVLDRRRKHFPSLVSEGRERRIELVSRAIDIAADLEAPVVSLWSGAVPQGTERSVAWDRLRAGCDELLRHAAMRGVTLGFEPEPGMLVERLDDFEFLRQELGNPRRLGLTLDLGHCVCLEAEPVAWCVRRAAPWLVHVHADDMRRGVHEHLMFGEGDLELGPALWTLGDVGYEGMVAVELSRHSHRAHETVPRSIAVLQGAERARVTPEPTRGG
jgi:L-ribulose-5-phosphate 3-epimerase